MKVQREDANTILIHIEDKDRIDMENPFVMSVVKTVLDAVMEVDDPKGEYAISESIGSDGTEEVYEYFRKDPLDEVPATQLDNPEVPEGSAPAPNHPHAVAS